MSEIAGMIDNLENNINSLLKKIDSLERKNQDLNNELIASASMIRVQTQEIEDLKVKYEAIKMANTLLGSENHKKDTKSKINSLIREIDYCIVQLAD